MTGGAFLPWKVWRDALLASWREAGDDNIGLIAAGVAFYGFLAMVPMLGAIVLSYGLFAEPETVIHDMQVLTSVLPADAAHFIGEQLMDVVQTSSGKKGFGAIFALALALFGARNGAGAIITALNVAYETREKRGFIAVNLLAIGTTGIGVLVAIAALVAVAALGHLQRLMPTAPIVVLVLGKLLPYAVLALTGITAAAILYRFGPSRSKARWMWITPGSLLAAACWMVLSLGFGVYVSKLGNYNATYGSLSAAAVLLTWLYLSLYALLFGAELNAELDKRDNGSNPPPAHSPGHS